MSPMSPMGPIGPMSPMCPISPITAAKLLLFWHIRKCLCQKNAPKCVFS